jgi:NitT/TauT family transport system ATP-binding protein
MAGTDEKSGGAISDIGPAGQTNPATNSRHVVLQDVSLVYGSGDRELLAVQRLNLTVKQGEFVAVVGPSGCGKSTLMKLVTGLLLPDEGAVFIDGTRTRGPVKNVGMVFQHSTLMPWRSTLSNVMLPFEIVEPHKHQLRRNFERYITRAKKLLDEVGLLEFTERYPWELSGGMQQRANVCRALVHDPELLMLDEPFSALDAFTREDLWTLMQQLWLEQRFSVILVTHDLREAVFLADRVAVMSARPGKIIFEREIDLSRPRKMTDTFGPKFGAIVLELRTKIEETRL